MDARIARKILAASAGNLLEWYDFGVFGIFASEIGSAFFPASDQSTSLIWTFGAFAGAFAARPLGGMIFGHIGDTAGREIALLLTILLMAMPTLAIGLLPTYEQIGMAAPVLLVAMRLVQGVAAGGELPGALVYAVESAAPQHRAALGALCQATGLGSMLASAVAAVLHAALGDDEAWYVLSLRDVGSRYTALGLAYNLGAALLGGTTPLIASALSSTRLGPSGTGIYLSLAALTAAATLALSEYYTPLRDSVTEAEGGSTPSTLLTRRARTEDSSALAHANADTDADAALGGKVGTGALVRSGAALSSAPSVNGEVQLDCQSRGVA